MCLFPVLMCPFAGEEEAYANQYDEEQVEFLMKVEEVIVKSS